MNIKDSKVVSKSKIMDLNAACRSFPEVSNNNLNRENILDTIDLIFEDETDVILLEGQEGMGKTTVLTQFSLRHSNNAISLFIKPSSRYGYDPQLLKFDLCNQLQWLNKKKEIKNLDDIVDEGFLKMQILETHRMARRNKETYYFVIDGIDDIPQDSEYVQKLILDMLPFGLKGFKFIFSCNKSKDLQNELSNQKLFVKPFPLSGFTKSEILEFLGDFEISQDHLREIQQTCKGFPGYLATVKRILDSGISVEAFINDMPNKLPGLFELEWKQVDQSNEPLIDILAILAHDRKRHTVDVFSEILNISKGNILAMVSQLSFIEIDEKEEVSYVSEAFRVFASNALKHFKEKTGEILIDYFLQDPDSEEAIKYLPGYLAEANKLNKLVEFLGADNFLKILEKTQSLNGLNQITDLGVEASYQLKNDAELLRLGLQKSIIYENNKSKIWNSEIEAMMSHNEYNKAIALAQRAILIEDQFQMLTIICKHKVQQGLSPETELLEQIENLYQRIDYSNLGERSLKIASDLIYFNPELAIDLVEKSTGSQKGENAIDWALATLSFSTIDKIDNNYDHSKTIQDIKSRIKDPDAKFFSTEVSLRFKESSGQEVLEEAQKLENASDQLYLLSRWASRNEKLEGAYEVIKYALKKAIGRTEYSPNARVYRNLSKQIPYLETVQIKEIMGIIDSQLFNIERLGPTEEYIGLQLLLAKAQKIYDLHGSGERLVNLYLYISEVEDLSVLASGQAQLLSTISKIDVEMSFENSDGLHTMIYNDLEQNIKQLLENTAEHYVETKPIIKVLAISHPDFTLSLIRKLNIESRRDAAYSTFLQSYIEQPLTSMNLYLVMSTYNQIINNDNRDKVLLGILVRIAEEEATMNDELLTELIPYIDIINSMYEVQNKCQAYCIVYPILIKSEKYKTFGVRILEELYHTWKSIDVGWRKVDIGFEIVKKLANVSLEESRKFLKITEDFREEAVLSDPDFSWAYTASVRLVVRSFSGLIHNNLFSEDDLERLNTIINIIPSYGERALLWNELALRFYNHGRIDKCKMIVSNNLKPCINQIPTIDLRYRHYIIVNTAPSLYLAHKLTAFDLLKELPSNIKDNAILNIVEYILTKHMPNEPYETVSGMGYDLDYEELVDICELIDETSSDSLMYKFINDIADSIDTRKFRNNYSHAQRFDIANRLETLIQQKLPNEKFIKHEGYKIVSLAQILRIKRANAGEWLSLKEKVKGIDNASDRALVMSIIACSLPSNKLDKTKEILKEAEGIIDNIAVTLDKIQLYESIGGYAYVKEQALSRKYLKLGMQESLKKDSKEIYPVQRRIIDIAHRIDPDFSASLVSLTDDDPTKKRTKLRLNEEIKKLELKDNLISVKTIEEDQKSILSEAAWRLLGSLNANRVETLNLESIRVHLRSAADLPFSESFSIISWVIENVVKRYFKGKNAVNYIRPMFESTINGVDTILKLSGRNITQIKNLKRNMQHQKIDSFVVKPGKREEVLEFLGGWFKENIKDYLKICDPYFGPQDLEVLKILLSVKPQCKVEILTSKQHQDKQKFNTTLDEAYRNYWKMNISDQQPPKTDIVIVGTTSGGQLPIHDRWWITKGGGLRIGTSFNSIGISRESEISVLVESEATEREAEVDKYLYFTEREYNGQRLSYSIIPL
ncbi:hypothetical protein POL82_27070 (plasmid) [Priestia aryabhattai]|uniref:hypothetical protein n=1 Tax=Priestia aryabhattai TaxID=412384 RepID=UPI00234F99A7|nr:hypothetical protein [Priestia aryabhattai]MDC7767147.1 hypothetical protein [Priestia aryabhattai]